VENDVKFYFLARNDGEFAASQGGLR